MPILDNLKAWLQPIAKTSGPIVGPNLRKRHEAARLRAGIKEWPDNCMRHSFVSYRLATSGNAPQTALESGHDQTVLFKHYRELVRPKDAEQFFSIRPVGVARFRLQDRQVDDVLYRGTPRLTQRSEDNYVVRYLTSDARVTSGHLLGVFGCSEWIEFAIFSEGMVQMSSEGLSWRDRLRCLGVCFCATFGRAIL